MRSRRTPSFSVSKSKNICKCFQLQQGGSPVNFMVGHEQMTYQEALRYLARKYNIEIKERKDDRRGAQTMTERASLLAVNEFALRHFRILILMKPTTDTTSALQICSSVA